MIWRGRLLCLLAAGTLAAGCVDRDQPGGAPAPGATPVAALAGDADARDVALLAAASGSQPFSPTSETDDVSFHTLAVALPEGRVDGCLRQLWTALPANRQVFQSQCNFGIGGKLDEVRVLQSSDPLDVLRYCRTASPRYGLTNEEVVARVESWQRQHPFRLRGAGRDYVLADLRPGTSMTDAWAAEVARLCPDAVSRGTGSIANLQKLSNSRRQLFLWWLPPAES